MKHILDALCIGLACFWAGYLAKAIIDYLRIKRLRKAWRKDWRQWMRYYQEDDYARRERK